MSARAVVAAALANLELPILDGRLPDQITTSTLVLGVEKVEPGQVARQRVWTIWLALLTRFVEAGVEDDLEQTLTDVLDALDHARPSPLAWASAERRPVKDDAYHAYVITVTVTMQEE